MICSFESTSSGIYSEEDQSGEDQCTLDLFIHMIPLDGKPAHGAAGQKKHHGSSD